MNEIKVKVLGASAYDFKDNETGRQVAGVNVWFLEEHAQRTDTTVGFIPKKVAMPLDYFTKVSQLSFPCEANAVLSAEFTPKGVRTKIVDFKPLGKVQN